MAKAICSPELDGEINSRDKALISLINKPFRFQTLYRMGIDPQKTLQMAALCRLQRPNATAEVLRREAGRLVHTAPHAVSSWRTTAKVASTCAKAKAATACAAAMRDALATDLNASAAQYAEALQLEGTSMPKGSQSAKVLLAKAVHLNPTEQALWEG